MLSSRFYLVIILLVLIGCSSDGDSDNPPDSNNPPQGDNLIYLDNNGVTIICSGQVGETDMVNGKMYIIVNNITLRELVDNGQDLTYICTSKVTDLDDLFEQLGGENGGNIVGNISSWDVSNVTSMNTTFRSEDFDQDLSFWDVSNVSDMRSMFDNSNFNQDISSWDVSNVTNMDGMFSESSFNQNISDWDVSNVINMRFMFSSSDFNQDISSWNVSKVTNMEYMFLNSPFNQDLSGWDVFSCRVYRV